MAAQATASTGLNKSAKPKRGHTENAAGDDVFDYSMKVRPPSPESNPAAADIPFDPARTVELASRKEWRWYTEPASRKAPHGVFARAGLLLRCCLPGAVRLRRAAAKERSVFGLPVLRPDAFLVRAWAGVITVVDLSYTAFLVPISIGFDNLYLGSSWTWLTYTDCAGTLCYVWDMLLEFHTGFIVKYDIHRALVLRGGDVAGRYVRRGGFVVDVLAILAIVPEVVFSSVPSLQGSGFKAFYLFRLLRLLRVARMLRATWELPLPSNPLYRLIHRHINTATFFLFTVLYLMAVFVNLLGCMWWFLAEMEGLEFSWVAHAKVSPDLLTANGPARYVASIYFAMTVLTTVGFGDITPWTVAEQLLASFYMLCSILYFGYVVNVVGQLLSMVSAKSRTAAAVREKLEDIESWMARRHIPRELQMRVRRYYFEVWAPHGAGLDDANYFSELPMELRGEIVTRLAAEAMRESRMLRLLSDEVRGHLAACAVPLRLLAGHDLYREGEPSDRFWVLQEGEAAVMRGLKRAGGVRAPAILGQAAVFAEWVEDCRERLHSVRAVTNCTLWEFDGRTLYRVAKHQPEVLCALCTSYLKYLEELEERATTHGLAVPASVPRIRQQVRQLAGEAEERLAAQRERQRQRGGGGAGLSQEADDLGVPPDEQQEVGGESPGASVAGETAETADSSAATAGSPPSEAAAAATGEGGPEEERRDAPQHAPAGACDRLRSPSLLERKSVLWRGPVRWRSSLRTVSAATGAIPEEEQFDDMESGRSSQRSLSQDPPPPPSAG